MTHKYTQEDLKFHYDDTCYTGKSVLKQLTGLEPNWVCEDLYYVVKKGVVYFCNDAICPYEPDDSVEVTKIGIGEDQDLEDVFIEYFNNRDVNYDNFFDDTIATWHIPEDWQIKEDEPLWGSLIYESEDGSKYWYDEVSGYIYRLSDHWGGGIGSCNWYLEGHDRCNSFKFKEKNEGKKFFGIIKIYEFIKF